MNLPGFFHLAKVREYADIAGYIRIQKIKFGKIELFATKY
jgi:hypothetical protein